MTKDQLTAALHVAHGALAGTISSAHAQILRARRSYRTFPHVHAFYERLAVAVAEHDIAKEHLTYWLSPEEVRTVRARAAQQVRSALDFARRQRIARAAKAAQTLAIAA